MDADDAAELQGIEAKMIMAEVANQDPRGLANLLGAGLSQVSMEGAGARMVVALFLRVPRGIGVIDFRLELVDAHGQSVEGSEPFEGRLEPNGDMSPEGRPIDMVFPIQVGLRLADPPEYLEWRLWLNEITHSSWKAGFYTAPGG
jgi:hypothetical protein